MLTESQRIIIIHLKKLGLLTEGQAQGAIHTDNWTAAVEKAYQKYRGLDSNNAAKTQQQTNNEAKTEDTSANRSTKQTASQPLSSKKCDVSGIFKAFVDDAKKEWSKLEKRPFVAAVTLGLITLTAALLIEHYSRPTLPKNGVEFSLQRIERKLIEIEEKKSPTLKDYKELAALRTELARVHELERLKIIHKGQAVKECIQAVNQNEKLQAFQAQLEISNCIEQLSK